MNEKTILALFKSEGRRVYTRLLGQGALRITGPTYNKKNDVNPKYCRHMARGSTFMTGKQIQDFGTI
ncbi:unnamed protein product [Aphanomyces euteiches]